jgi:hypothetical protein
MKNQKRASLQSLSQFIAITGKVANKQIIFKKKAKKNLHDC